MTPTATYRLQFGPSFKLSDAAALVPYLDALGVSHVYASPLLGSRRGSPHGYDVTDADHIDAEIGGAQAFDALVRALHERGMGLVLDIVPNHMAASTENAWWRDVLRHGPASPYSQHFDIDWEPARPGLANKVLLPVLEAHYGELLEQGALRLELTAGGLVVRCHALGLPVNPGGHAMVLRDGLDGLARRIGGEHFAVRGLAVLAEAFERYDHATGTLGPRIRELWDLYQREPQARAHLDALIERWNGTPGDPDSFDSLDRLLEAQFYRVAYWPVANQEINYRRFFDISDLVSLRIDDPGVFAETHALVLRLVAEGMVSGLRIDHVDGLRDPLAYLGHLRERVGPDGYLVVEKILAPDEELPDEWPVQGTTGYELGDALGRLSVDQTGLDALRDLHARATGEPGPFAEIAYAEKRRALTEMFGGELRNLAARLGRLAETHRHGRDLTLTELGRALVSVTASLPVYRTYIRDVALSLRDRRYLRRAIDDAVRRDPAVSAASEFLRRALLLEMPAHLSAEQRDAWLRFVTSWQQVTGAVMAKGVEDGAFYRWSVLVSRNEVGSDPDTGALTVPGFHELMARRQERWPWSMNASSTHDTKRSEDVRARIDVLSQIPEAWAGALERWRARNPERATVVAGVAVPDPDMELLLLQTLVGAWPPSDDERAGLPDRMGEYARKAAREAKRRTSWLSPDEEYEDALVAFARRLASAAPEDPLVEDLVGIHDATAFHGVLGSLANVVLKIASPGVPDVYQGTELTDLSLVDPDNRRPVDFAARRSALAELDAHGDRRALVRELLASYSDGRTKLLVTAAGLRSRRKRPALYGGEYVPLEVTGPRGSNVCVFMRRAGGEQAIAAVALRTAQLVEASAGLPALRAPVGDDWSGHEVRLPEGAPRRWASVITGQVLECGAALPLSEVFADLPVALLEPLA